MFKKGVCANPAGRPKGAENKVSRDVRALAQKLFDAAYWKRTKQRLDAGELNPAIEGKLLAYAYGEPKKTVTIDGEIGIREKRRVLTQIPDHVVAAIAAQEQFEATDSSDETVN
jgi:hypothetical protein